MTIDGRILNVTDNGKPTPEEVAALLEETTDALVNFEGALARFGGSAWRQTPEDGGWSAADIGEHVLLANRRLFDAVLNHRSSDVTPDWAEITRGKEEWIRNVLPSQGKAKASVLLSTFTGLSRNEVNAGLHDFHRRFADFCSEARGLSLHAITWPHGFLGPISAYQWLLYIPFHTQRHQAQLERLALASRE